jgi:class 3 adenylate cyclase/predicted ATPase
VEVADWLRQLDLEQYIEAFAENAVDRAVLPTLTADDLREIGVSAVGHRRKLLNAIAALAEPIPSVAPGAALAEAELAAGAERRQLTVMFCDLVGSTPLSARFDPEDLREIIAAYHRAVAATVIRFSGFVAKYMGDGVLIYFGYPQAHEDDAERAVRAGLAVIEAVGGIDAPAPLGVRLGIASGLVVVGDLIGEGAAQEQAVVGETPNLAARLQGLAAPNTVVIADATRRPLGDLFEVEDLGPQSLAGFAERQRAWRVLGESGVANRFEALRSGATPLVGRDEELDLLLRRWRQASASEGRVVLVTGEPGIGKSRLSAALAERIADEPHTRIRYFSSPHHQDSALYPFISQLERAAGFSRDDAPGQRLQKLEKLLATSDRVELALIADLLALPNGAGGLELSPQKKRERLFEALLHQLEAVSRQNPVLMIYEDAHWADPTSREVLDLMVERIRQLPVLLVITFRQEFQPPWAGQPHVAMIALNRLGGTEGTALVQDLVGNATLDDAIIAEIVERTDGVPLFVEELTKAVLEAGGDRHERTVSGTPIASLAVPATLHASLLGRLDRLGAMAKHVAQTGAAIGREFSYELLAATARLGEGELQEGLRRLVDAGLIFQRGTPPDALYLFKHALVQDTAYSTLLRSRRQNLHGTIAAALEEHFPDLAETRPEIVAHHYGEAAMPEKAVLYWLAAGRLSVAKSAVAEAIAQLNRGLDQLRSLPETAERNRLELDLQIPLVAALLGARGYAHPDVSSALERSRQLVASTAATGTPLHFLVLYGTWVVDYVGGNIEGVLRHARQFLSLAEQQPNPAPRLIGHRILAAGLLVSGDFAEARPHVETAVALYQPEEHREFAFRYGQDIGASALCYLCWAQWHLGCPDQAQDTADRALRHARDFGHAHTLAYTLWHIAIPALLARDVARVDAFATESVAVSAEHGFPLWLAYADILLGWVSSQRGQHAAGINRMRRGIAAASKTGARVLEPLFLGLVADALAFAGAFPEASAVLEQALARSAEAGERWADAELHRLRGELALRVPQPDVRSAETSFRTAMEIAGRQGARGFELRSATRLARLIGQQGRRDEARELLAPIYGWFTEGFDTPDLQDAKALLAELA